MRLKSFWWWCLPAVLAAGFVGRANAQVAPSARVGGLPIGFGVGISDYSIDYGQGRRMAGPAAWLDIGIFRGFGIDGSARSLYFNVPTGLTRMQQSTFLGGVHYESKPIFHVRPFVRVGAGTGLIEFPSDNPLYTRDTYSVFAPSGGVEIPIVPKVFLRAEYEYQFWKDYHGTHDLTPNGVTLGVSYYLRGMHVRSHANEIE